MQVNTGSRLSCPDPGECGLWRLENSPKTMHSYADMPKSVLARREREDLRESLPCQNNCTFSTCELRSASQNVYWDKPRPITVRGGQCGCFNLLGKLVKVVMCE